RRAMDRPRPTPPGGGARAGPTREKGANRRGRGTCGTPGPGAWNVVSTCPSPGRGARRTSPSGGVWVIWCRGTFLPGAGHDPGVGRGLEIRGGVENQAAGASLGFNLDLIDDIGEERGDIDGRAVNFFAGHGEQLGYELVEPLGLAGYAVEGLLGMRAG